MPTVIFPLEYLQRLTDATPEQLAQQAFNYGLDVELLDHALQVEVTAERPDLLAAEGFTRAINIYSGAARTVPESLAASGRSVQVSPTVADLRPHIAALIVENAHLEAGGLEVLIQFQEKVTQTFGRQRKKIAIGVYDLDQIEGDLEYTAVASDQLTFVPLNADHPMTARQILTEHPAGLSYGHTLPTRDRVPVLRDARHTILSMPPVINAAGIGEVNATTRNLFIDVTGIVERTVLETVNILAHNFLDTGAAVKTVAIATPSGTLTTPTLARKSIPFSAKFLNEIVGTSIPKSDLGHYLARMDLSATGTNLVEIPTYRTDIFSEVDLAGDLLVAVGLDNLNPEPIAIRFYTGQADSLKEFVLHVGDLAQRMELMEVKSFILIDPDLLSRFSTHYVQTENAKSRTYSTARTTLQAGLLEILSRNINAPKPINIYETGEVLVMAPTGDIQERWYWGFASLDARASFATAKAYVQTLLKALQVPYQLANCELPHYIPGRAAAVLVHGAIAGHFGEIHPHLLHGFSFPEPVCSGELDCQLMQAASAENATVS